MKLSKKQPVNTPDKPEKLPSSAHKSFIQAILSNDGIDPRVFKKHTFKRSIGTQKITHDVSDLVQVNESILEPYLKLHPEAVAFLFHIDGCSKNLFLFLLLKKLNLKTGKYFFNSHVREEFQTYTKDFFNEAYKEETVKQAHRKLVDANITCNVKTGLYFINPMITGGKTNDNRRNLLNEYSALLSSKSRNPKEDIYPIYKKE